MGRNGLVYEGRVEGGEAEREGAGEKELYK